MSGARLVAGLVLALVAPPLAAQGRPGLEAGVTSLATLATRDFAGAGLSAGFRPAGRMRIAVTLAAGAGDGAAAGRGELSGQFLLTPERTRGAGVYALGGVAGLVGRHDAGYAMVGLGLEACPGGASGWAVEAGVGGGLRLAVGWRWRRFRRQAPREP